VELLALHFYFYFIYCVGKIYGLASQYGNLTQVDLLGKESVNHSVKVIFNTTTHDVPSGLES